MNEEQKRLIDLLNDMYCSQGKEWRETYREHYFELLGCILGLYQVRISGKEIMERINAMESVREKYKQRIGETL